MSDWLQKIKNAIIGGAVAESPAVMTASGWKQDKDGNWKQEPDKGSQQLAENIATIGEAGVTAPTLVSDIGLVLKGITHPVKTAGTVKQTVLDMLWFLKNPRATKVYHGTRSPEFTDLRQGKPYSVGSVGIHVTPKKEIAQSFVSRGGHILEGYIPKHNMETIDLWGNNYNLLSNNIRYKALPKGQGFYEASGEPKLFFSLLQKYGAKPIKEGNKIYTEKSITIPLQKETWKAMPKEARKEADRIIKEGSEIRFGETSEQSRARALKANQDATKLFSDNGKKVIKYNNVSSFEGNGGVSYMVTDPNVFHIASPNLSQNILDFSNVIKHGIWTINE